jgi:hypothetical protein
MKLKFGAIVTDGRGKIGGHVASKNRSGAYLRTKVTPSNPNTVAQSQARGILASLSQGWGQLTDSQRLGWNDAVKEWGTTDIFGDIKNPSGINLFVKLNANLISVGFPQLSDVPKKMEVPSVIITSASLSISGDDLSINFDNSTANGVKVLVRATPTLSAGVSFVKSQFRVVGYEVVSGSACSLLGAYSAKFGVPLVGANIYANVQFVLSNGQKTTEQKVKLQVVL